MTFTDFGITLMIVFSTRPSRVLNEYLTLTKTTEQRGELMELAERKRKILSAIIESYISTGEPVGSKSLISEAGLEVSSATVRNEMADLTSRGFLIQPHTSAGRIPTQQAYRYYVDNIMNVTQVSEVGRDYIFSSLSKNADSPENILQSGANLLSQLTNYVAVATTPDTQESRVRKISFVQTGAHTAMVVLIASNGTIKTKLFRCEFVITPEILEVFDKALNELFTGVKLTSINQPFIQTAAARFGELSFFMPSVLTAIKDASGLAKEISVCRSGITKLMYMSELNYVSARGIVEFINSEHDLSKMLENLPITTSVSIGLENSRIELATSTVVSTRYSIDANPSGVLAVLGPLRMDYARVISILECVSECVGNLISELIEI